MVATITTQLGIRPRVAALDVEELFHADVGAEAGFGEHVAIRTNQLERDLVGHDGRIAVRDIRKRAGVNERGRAFERLHQVGLNRVLHQHGQRAAGADIVRRDRLAGLARADDHRAQFLAHVRKAGGEREDGHDLAGDRNVVAGHAGHALFLGTLADGDLAQHAVVGIGYAAPGDAVRIDIEMCEPETLFRRQIVGIGFRDAQLAQAAQHHGRKAAAAVLRRRAKPIEQRFGFLRAFVEPARVNGRGEQIVGSGDGVNIAGEVKIELLHRNDLAIAAARGAALDAERGSLARLAHAGENFLAEVRAERLAEADRGGRLAFAEGRGRDRGDDDVFSVGHVLQAVANLQVNFCLVLAVHLELVRQNARSPRQSCRSGSAWQPGRCQCRWAPWPECSSAYAAYLSPPGNDQEQRLNLKTCDELVFLKLTRQTNTVLDACGIVKREASGRLC